ncbi:acyltransferase [Streptomyces yokosukanensis]|uniref:acyltransferase family protein n=1 Tax=Streptomyces yokosukanensis TaxID=67386 RepID=UPI0034272079
MPDIAAASSAGDPPRHRASLPSLPSLTGLRFIAALLVFLTHSTVLANPLQPTAQVSFFADHDIAKPLADFAGKAGAIGVSFFFVLSGFVLTWSATPGDRPTAFWRRRGLKIYPNHIVTWALAMWLFASSQPVHAWLSNLFLVHAFSNRLENLQSVNWPVWSLCSELLFYALFPLLIVLVRRIAERRLWLWAAGAVAGVVAMAAVTKLVPGGLDTGHGLTLNQYWFSYMFPPPRLFEFGLGMILARIVAAGLWPRIGLLPSAVLFAGGYWLANETPPPYYFSATTIVPIAMLICAAASSDLRGDSGWLRSRTMVWLGKVSFAFYMVQVLVVFYGRREVLGAHTYGFLPALGLYLALFLANLLAAALLYGLVEQPVMRRLGRRGKRPAHDVPATATAAAAARGTTPTSVPTGELG